MAANTCKLIEFQYDSITFIIVKLVLAPDFYDLITHNI